MGTDEPIRLFRRRSDIQFYGTLHEQPQMGDCNGDIVPSLQINDVQIAHTGYLHESLRRQKAIGRNLPMLVRDRQEFPDRELGHLLVLRDFANLALWARERSGGELTDEAKEHQRNAIALFERYFADPSNRFHAKARPFYESALMNVAGAIEVEIAVAGRPGGLGQQHARPERIWVRTPAQLRQILQARIDAMLGPLEHPTTLDCEPLDPSQMHVLATSVAEGRPS
jgi:hypothetical protein